MENIELGALINLYISTPGRRIYSLRQVRERAQARGLTELVERIDRALVHERKTQELESRWGASLGTTQKLPSTIDPLIDRTLLLIEQIVLHLAGDPDPEVAAYAAELATMLFPQGASHHIQLPYIDQLAANERVLGVLEAKKRKDWIDRMGLRVHVTRLRALNTQFDQALRSRDGDKDVSYADVREARAAGQKHFVQVTAAILGRFCDDADAEARTELLAPIMAQNEQISIYRRRRRRVDEVDADTGEPIEEAPGNGETPAAGEQP